MARTRGRKNGFVNSKKTEKKAKAKSVSISKAKTKTDSKSKPSVKRSKKITKEGYLKQSEKKKLTINYKYVADTHQVQIGTDENKKPIYKTVNYYKMRYGNQYLNVTKSVGENLKSYIEKVNKIPMTKEQYDKFHKHIVNTIKHGQFVDMGRTAVMMDNITKRTGIFEYFKSRGKGHLDDNALNLFNELNDKLEIINTDITVANDFYDDFKDKFQDITGFYQTFLSKEGAVFTKDSAENLIKILEELNAVADVYVNEVKSNQK